jgi:hypothetical protein
VVDGGALVDDVDEVVEGEPVVGVIEIVVEVDVGLSVVVVVGSDAPVAEGVTISTGAALTWESARLTICQARTVVTATTTTQAAISFHEGMSPFSQSSPQRHLRARSRFAQPGSRHPGRL